MSIFIKESVCFRAPDILNQFKTGTQTVITRIHCRLGVARVGPLNFTGFLGSIDTEGQQ